MEVDVVNTVLGYWWVAVLLVLVIGFAVLLAINVFVVRQQEIVIVERFGKFSSVAQAGLRVKWPFIDRKVASRNLRQQQTKVEVDTKTKDNVFIKLVLAVQHRISDPQKAYYELNDPESQMKSYVFNVVRAAVPEMNMDQVFEAKDKLALEVKQTLGDKMKGFGYEISDVLATDITPPKEIQDAMNQVVTQERNKIANEQKGEAEKILVVKAAEAKRDQDKLHGEGIALQRQAIAHGLSAAVKDLEDATGLEASAALNLVTLTQWLDMMTKVGGSAQHVVFLSSAPNSVNDISQQLQSALLATPKSLPSISRRKGNGENLSERPAPIST